MRPRYYEKKRWKGIFVFDMVVLKRTDWWCLYSTKRFNTWWHLPQPGWQPCIWMALSHKVCRGSQCHVRGLSRQPWSWRPVHWGCWQLPAQIPVAWAWSKDVLLGWGRSSGRQSHCNVPRYSNSLHQTKMCWLGWQTCGYWQVHRGTFDKS